ncbi:E3 ubiquitin-protein ligase DCST1-like [Tachypleus tridentatus]|uniref:E3 ubiquitin-protein ligase DCST1-like n=1 Tax=Tachypleus tridentatus TaxID=6853 RepID=UPI003FD668E1
MKKKTSLSIEVGTGKHRVYDRLRHCIRGCFQKLCPIAYRFFFSSPSEFRATKAVLGFPFGVFLGYVLYQLFIKGMKLTPSLAYSLRGLLMVILGFGYAASVQVRAIFWLIVPTFFGRIGRSYLNTFAMTILVAGPIYNILYNAHDSVRVMGCFAGLSFNHSVEKLKLMYKPVKNLMADFSKEGKNIHEEASKLEEKIKPLEYEVENQDEKKELEKDIDYVDTIEDRESRVKMVYEKYMTMVSTKFGEETENEYAMKLELRCEGKLGFQ